MNSKTTRHVEIVMEAAEDPVDDLSNALENV